jgi:hypothetical protein
VVALTLPGALFLCCFAALQFLAASVRWVEQNIVEQALYKSTYAPRSSFWSPFLVQACQSNTEQLDFDGPEDDFEGGRQFMSASLDTQV